MKRASKKAAKVVDEVEEVEQIVEPVAEVAPADAPLTPKDQLREVSVTLADLLPTYSGPGRRHIEAALLNVNHAIRYTP